MDPRKKTYSVGVFPLLRTSGPVRLGSLTFRSTDDLDGLPSDQAASVAEIADMLFASGNQRIERASYTIMKRVDLDYSTETLEPLADIEAVVAYFYARPRHSVNSIFLRPEDTAMAVLTPDQVPSGLVRHDFNVLTVGRDVPLELSRLGFVNGYAGRLGFRLPFWVAPGSRLYATVPYPALNHYQDLVRDIERARGEREDYRFLLELLADPNRDGQGVRRRAFTALRWFNKANSEHRDDADSFLCLSIALETLLRVPRDAKTKRLVDAVALLLGREPRLSDWAEQFYNARSEVVHEGSVQEPSFVVRPATGKRPATTYQSLLAYGREVFQLCLGTVLAGASLSSRADLGTKLIANSERFETIIQTLQDGSRPPEERLHAIRRDVLAIRRYRWVKDTGITVSCVAAACCYAAKVTLESDWQITEDLRKSLAALATAPASEDSFERMDALRTLVDGTKNVEAQMETGLSDHVASFLSDCWMYVFRDYYDAREVRGTGAPN